jgi:hypothetical protein
MSYDSTIYGTYSAAVFTAFSFPNNYSNTDSNTAAVVTAISSTYTAAFCCSFFLAISLPIHPSVKTTDNAAIRHTIFQSF